MEMNFDMIMLITFSFIVIHFETQADWHRALIKCGPKQRCQPEKIQNILETVSVAWLLKDQVWSKSSGNHADIFN